MKAINVCVLQTGTDMGVDMTDMEVAAEAEAEVAVAVVEEAKVG